MKLLEVSILKDIPILFRKKKLCCGCTACYAVCPKDAITMEPDEEGFDYPKVDESKCIRCYKCLKVCPIKEKRVLSLPRKNEKTMFH